MRITTYEMWKYFTYSHPKLMRAVEGTNINQAREALWDYNEDLFSRGRPEIPDITAVFLHFLKRWGDTKMIYNVNTDLYKELIKREKEKTGVEVRNVGYHIGTLIKNQKARGIGSGHGGRKRSHLRRAHWHHYWVGKRDGERQLILKWVLATAIHPEGLDELPTIVKMGQPSVLTEA